MTNDKRILITEGTEFHVHEGKIIKIDGKPVADEAVDRILVLNRYGKEVMRLSNDGTVIDSVVEGTLNPDTCPDRKYHGNPHRYCILGCGYAETETEQEFLGNKLSLPIVEHVDIPTIKMGHSGMANGDIVPTPTKPTLGRVVHYRLNENDARAINIRRNDWHEKNIKEGIQRDGYQAHVGNAVEAGQVFAADIVRVWDDGHVNLQVKLDGNDVFWATSRVQGDEDGNWFWPPRV